MLSILAGTCLASFLIALALPGGVDFVFSLGPIIEVVVVMEIDGGGHGDGNGEGSLSSPRSLPPPPPQPLAPLWLWNLKSPSLLCLTFRGGDSPAPPFIPLPALRGVISPQTEPSTSSLYPLLGLLLPWRRPN